jgi:hypothetical protein
MSSSDVLHEDQVERLLKAADLPPAEDVLPITGGRNNKVFRVRTASGDFLFKIYFHHPEDLRDRTRQEFEFLTHLARIGCCFSAKPLASLPEEHVGMMEFIEGVRPQLSEVDERHIVQATEFFFEANRDTTHPEARCIRPASEACFTIQEHLRCTQSRVERLDQMLLEDDVDREAGEFVRQELRPLWKTIRRAIEDGGPTLGSLDIPLPQDQRCLSPSDFGFHNSLRQKNGSLRFLDFEYAGWDDPAKLIADFANQPDMILERALSDRFRNAVIASSSDGEALVMRVKALEPLYQIKWACICLNDFLSFGRTRHRFTDGEKSDNLEKRSFQLTRAQTMLERAKSTFARN